jgi:predicted secreted protein
MTSAQSGMDGSLWVCATENGTYKKLGELSDLKLNIDGKEIDTSNVDDSGWGSSIMGAKNWEVPASNNLILADDGYAIVIAALFTTDPLVYVKILTSGTPTVSPVGWKGLARVLGGKFVIAGTNTQQKVDWTIKGSGALAAV